MDRTRFAENSCSTKNAGAQIIIHQPVPGTSERRKLSGAQVGHWGGGEGRGESRRVDSVVALVPLQDMGDDGCAAAADVLGHAHPGPGNLVPAGFTTQLLYDFYHLVHSGSSDRVATSL